MTASFLDFPVFDIERDGVRVHGRIGGSGAPLLLLHGHPQTHAIWHRVAPALAERFTVVAIDLRGYGDSGRPAADAAHENHSKRAMALDALAAMRHHGFERFGVLAHDRGARVAHRLCVDHPERDDANWFCHTRLYKDAHGAMASRKQAVEPYVIPVDVQGVGKANSYAHLRIPQAA